MSEQAQATDSGPRPLVSFLRLDPKPHLEGARCRCGAVYPDVKRVACSKCGATAPFEIVPLSNRGTVHVFSVVHQSFPGIKTPYVTAIVDLPEGATVRANLVDVSPEEVAREPKKVFGMPVEMVTSVVAKDREGHDVVGFAYRPIKN